MPRIHKYGESKTTRIMMAAVLHVTSGSGLRKFQADGFLFDGVYMAQSESIQKDFLKILFFAILLIAHACASTDPQRYCTAVLS